MKKIFKSFISLVIISIVSVIFYLLVATIESTVKDDLNSTKGALGLTVILFVALSIIRLKKVWFNKEKQTLIEKSVYKKPKEVWLQHKNIDFVLTGVDYDNKNGIPRGAYVEDLEHWDKLQLEIDINNEYDKNAIMVSNNESDLGYVQKRYTKELKRFIISYTS